MFTKDKSFADRLIGYANELNRDIETTRDWIKQVEKNPNMDPIEKIAAAKAKKDIETAIRHSNKLRVLAEKYS